MNTQVITSQQNITFLCLSKCGQYVAAASNQRISLYSLPDLIMISIIDQAHDQPLNAFEFSENSKLLISTGQDSLIKFWTVPLMQCNWTINSLQNSINQLEQYIACGNQEGQVSVWNIMQRTMTMKFKPFSSCISHLQILKEDDTIKFLFISSTREGSAMYSWLKQEKILTLKYNLIKIKEHWMLVGDDSSGQILLINAWPNFSTQLQDSKIDFETDIQEIASLHSIEWHNSNRKCFGFTKEGVILHCAFENYEEVYKGGQFREISKSITHRKSTLKKQNSFNRIPNYFKKQLSPSEILFERLSEKRKSFINLHRRIVDAKYTVDPDYLLFALEDQSLLTYDVMKQKPFHQKTGTLGSAWSLKFSPSGQQIAVGDEIGILLIISTQSLQVIQRFQAHQNCIDSILFLGEEQVITKSKDNTIKVWNISAHQQIFSFNHDSDTQMKLSDNLKFMIIGNNNGSLTIYNIENWQSVSISSLSSEITAITFTSKEEHIIFADLDKYIVLIDWKQKVMLKQVEGHADPILSLASSGNQVASAGYDAVIKLWSIPSLTAIGVLKGHTLQVNHLIYSPEGQLLFSCSSDKSIIIWSILKMEKISELSLKLDQIVQFDLLFKDKMICYTQLDQVILWRGSTQTLQFSSQLQQDAVKSISFTKQIDYLTVATGKKITSFNIYTEDNINILKKKESISEQPFLFENSVLEVNCKSPIKHVIASLNRVNAICEDGEVYIYDSSNFLLLHMFKDQECLICSPDNSKIITATQQLINVWNGISFELIKTIPQEWVTIIAIKMNFIASADLRNQCKVWDTENDDPIFTFSKHEARIFDLQFSPFDRNIASAGADLIIYIWSILGEVKLLVGHLGQVNSLQFISKNQLLSASDDGTIKLWDIGDEDLLHNFAIHQNPIGNLIFYESQLAYTFDNNIVLCQVSQDIITDIQILDSNCKPLMQTQGFQVFQPNSALSRNLGTIFKQNLKNLFIDDGNLMNSSFFLTDETLETSYLFSKLRNQLLNQSDSLLDHLSRSSFLFTTFDEDLSFAVFNACFDVLNQINFENNLKFVQNMFYNVLNLPNSKGKRILSEILKQEKFSSKLSIKELQYLFSISKFLKSHISILHNASKYQVWYEKIKEIKVLNLARNSFLSSLLCKSQLLKNMDKTFMTFKLLTPQEIFQNEHFNLYKNTDLWPKCYSLTKANNIEQQINGIISLRDKIAKFNVNAYDNYIQDFIFELILEFEDLENIDLSYLNLTDEFCEHFCNHFLQKNYCPDLDIISNERISHVGQKYLLVLYTKHKSSRLNLQSLNQKQEVREKLQNNIKILNSDALKKKINQDYSKQVELLQYDLEELKRNLDYQLLQQEDQFLTIQEYYERQSETLKRSQALLNFGVWGYLEELIFAKNVTEYCIFCNKYVCIECHSSQHSSQDPCVLCLNCFQFHRGFNEILTCRKFRKFNIEKEKKKIYQQFKFTKQVCLYGKLKVLEKIYLTNQHLSSKLIFQLKKNLYKFLQWKTNFILTIQICISFMMQKYRDLSNRTQEDIKADILESIQEETIDQYKFNSNVFILEEMIDQNLYLIVSILIYVAQLLLSVSLPLFFPGEQTVLWIAHFIFIGFLVLALGLEYLFIRILIKVVNKPIEGEVKLIRDLTPLKFIIQLFTSILAKYDFYTDVIFLTVLYRNSNIHKVQQLYYLSIFFLVLPTSLNLMESVYIIINEIIYRMRKGNKEITLRCINFYSKLSILMEYESIAWILDKLASNNAIKIRKLYIPQKIVSSFFKVIFENIPQLTIQLIYQLELAGEQNITLVITTISTCINLITQIFVFLSAKSSSINELELAKLSQRLGLAYSINLNEPYTLSKSDSFQTRSKNSVFKFGLIILVIQ